MNYFNCEQQLITKYLQLQSEQLASTQYKNNIDLFVTKLEQTLLTFPDTVKSFSGCCVNQGDNMQLILLYKYIQDMICYLVSPQIQHYISNPVYIEDIKKRTNSIIQQSQYYIKIASAEQKLNALNL